MVTKEDIMKLAELSRIRIEEEELESLSREMGDILEYVGQVTAISSDQSLLDNSEDTLNTMREDENPNETGAFSEELIREFPQKEGNYLRVKKIL
jgi:aspartyl-tRNA(Asn)/glutamyl-tRNA(Gln) amidotransferase subunit C